MCLAPRASERNLEVYRDGGGSVDSEDEDGPEECEGYGDSYGEYLGYLEE